MAISTPYNNLTKIFQVQVIFSSPAVSQELRQALQTISQKCILCKFCQQECAFLQVHGEPKDIAEAYEPGNPNHPGLAFQCSLCRLCAAVCPVALNPADLFWAMRVEAVRRGQGGLPEHEKILAYEKRGTSSRYSYYALPKGCDTVFFPGCALPGSRPETTWLLFQHLRAALPTLGIVLDCCTNSSHDLGREAYFTAMFTEMRDYLVQHGIRRVLAACPTCYKIFSTYGGQLAAQTVYEFLAQTHPPTRTQLTGTVTMHDACAVRFDPAIHAAVRELCQRQGLSLVEMEHHGDKTFCCGEGGSVRYVAPEFAERWGALRKGEADDTHIVTYCAGCANFLGKVTPASHVLDLLFQPEAALAGKVRVAKAPLTYWHRLKLKKRTQTSVDAAVIRERVFTALT